FDLAAHETIGRRLHDLELGDGGLAEAVDLVKPFHRRRDHLGEGAEHGEQLLRERLHVALRDGAKQNQLEHLVIADRLASGREKSLPQALAMAVVMRLLGGRCRRLVVAGHRSIIRAASWVARPLRIKMTVLYLVLQCPHHDRRPRESGDPYSRVGGYGSPQRGPRDASVAGCPSWGRQHEQINQTHARGATEGRGRSSPCGESVKISTPASVTATVCSNWAESERSRVTAVQPSESTFTCGRPRLIIGSTVKNMPGRSTMPSPGRPTCTILGSSWNRRPTPWPQKSRTTLMCCAST